MQRRNALPAPKYLRPGIDRDSQVQADRVHLDSIPPIDEPYVVGCSSGSLKARSLVDGTLLFTIEQSHPRTVTSMIWVNFGGPRGSVVSGSDDGVIRVWSGKNFKILATHTAHTRTIKCLAALGNSEFYVSGGADAKIYVWEADEQQAKAMIPGVTPSTLVGIDDTRFAVSTPNFVRIYNADGQTHRQIPTSGSNMLPLRSLNGVCEYLVVSASRSLHVWRIPEEMGDTPPFEVGVSMNAHAASVNSLMQWTDDAYGGPIYRFVSACVGGTIRVWEFDPTVQRAGRFRGDVPTNALTHLSQRVHVGSCVNQMQWVGETKGDLNSFTRTFFCVMARNCVVCSLSGTARVKLEKGLMMKTSFRDQPVREAVIIPAGGGQRRHRTLGSTAADTPSGIGLNADDNYGGGIGAGDEQDVWDFYEENDMYDLTLVLTDDDGRELRCFKSIVLAQSTLETIPDRVEIPRCSGISEKELLLVFFGVGAHVDADKAAQLLIIFQTLQMPLYGFVLLKFVAEEASNDPDALLRLFHQTIETCEPELVLRLRQQRIANDLETDSDRRTAEAIALLTDSPVPPHSSLAPPISLSSPSAAIILKALRRALPLRSMLPRHIAFLERVCLTEVFFNTQPSSLDEDPLFNDIGCSPSELSINLLFQRALRLLFDRETNFNVVVTTAMEGERRFQCHKEVLIYRSPFFLQCLRFKGMEWSQAQGEDAEIVVDGLDDTSVLALIQFIYENRIHLTMQIPTLLKLVEHAEMYFDQPLQSYLIRRLSSLFAEENAKDQFDHALMKHGYLLHRLPERLQKELFSEFTFHFRRSNAMSLIRFSAEQRTEIDALLDRIGQLETALYESKQAAGGDEYAEEYEGYDDGGYDEEEGEGELADESLDAADEQVEDSDSDED